MGNFRNVFMMFCFLGVLSVSNSQDTGKNTLSVALLPDEKWWAGIINKGDSMPFGKNSFSFDFYGNDDGNQATPLLISDKGRYIWSEFPFRFSIRDDSIIIDHSFGEVFIKQNGNTLRSAYLDASDRFFPPSGFMPDSLLFSAPQYNLWIELMYNPNQKDVLSFASHVISNGLPPGVLMIDDNWSNYYGSFDFNKSRFPDAKKLIDDLHKMGFKVMVWICPFISPDSEAFRELNSKKLLLMDNEGKNETLWKDLSKPMIIEWWNGFSACLDLTNPETKYWLSKKLYFLMKEYGIDGFKLDAGDAHFYANPDLVSYKKVIPNEHTFLWATVGLDYKFNEYRAMWKMGGEPLVQRLRDKNHSWEDLRKLIPHILVSGLSGYAFTCPDLIGGGEINSFLGAMENLDQELIVRSAQCHALMPMMQFSVAPWRVLDSVHLSAVKKAVELRMSFVPLILRLVVEATKTGEPIVRHLEYVFPDQGFSDTDDQFMLGDKIMVAPMLEKGTIRSVRLPELKRGKWKSDNGIIYRGGRTILIEVPLDRLPYFKIVN